MAVAAQCHAVLCFVASEPSVSPVRGRCSRWTSFQAYEVLELLFEGQGQEYGYVHGSECYARQYEPGKGDLLNQVE